jgi:hypothetical protein
LNSFNNNSFWHSTEYQRTESFLLLLYMAVIIPLELFRMYMRTCWVEKSKRQQPVRSGVIHLLYSRVIRIIYIHRRDTRAFPPLVDDRASRCQRNP